ncbi:hypothetical protein CHS0354_003328 [Potamilus streckersoni]|uniref:WD repeat-containing protein 11 n=1 Tax=Potamilus streckersoni TaxID=2493646 RepID=A0AAE0VQN8_9BIVA|nr:hypothetical protein CHS0354_003328 [Potamilus streckersoni]
MKLSPKIFSGVLHNQNKGACDWGWQGLVAHGCHNFVTIVDPQSVQVLQVLDKHKGNVVKVKWARENYHHDLSSPYQLRLASGDSNGNIIIWDVDKGEPRAEFSDGNKTIQDLEWLGTQDASHDLLAALHPPYSLVLWNADTGTKLWKKSYTEVLISFSFDPFNQRNMAFLGQDCIVFIDDFSITRVPSSNGKKFYISSPSSQASKMDNSTGSLERKSKDSSSRNLAKRMTNILVGEGRQSQEEETVTLNECIQLLYHQSCRHHMILLYAREVLILDLEINQTVGIISMERTGSPFLQIVSVCQRDVLFCLHENGGITARVRRKTNAVNPLAPEGIGAFDDGPPSQSLDVMYDLRCQSDPIRMTCHCQVMAFACSPVSEKTLALVLSDSRVIFWDLNVVDFQPSNEQDDTAHISPLFTPGNSQLTANQNDGNRLPVVSSVRSPKLALCDLIGQSQILSPDGETALKGLGVALKFQMSGLLSGLVSPITVIRMCPALTTKNWKKYQPLLAVGSQSGTVQVVNVASGQIVREYNLHSFPVRGIDWASLTSLISFSYPAPGVSGLVKNEILLVDVTSGKTTPIRINRDQESPIEQIRISHIKQFFIISFRDKPLELWDLRSLILLREMSKGIPQPSALEWAPIRSVKILKKDLEQQQQTGQKSTGEHGDSVASLQEGMTLSSSSQSESTNSDAKSQEKSKEHFVFTDSEGALYHFIVEGSGFTSASKIPPENGLGTITWLSWKNDYLVFGDGDGQLCLWDLRLKTSRTTSTHRGWIKKIRFAPGRGNFKFSVLYNDGVDVWEVIGGKIELCSSIKSPREIPKIIDMEWSGSDRPVLATIDGCVHMCDISLKKSSSGIDDWDLTDPVFSPYLLQPQGSLLMKLVLQNEQQWQGEGERAGEYVLQLEGLMEENKELQNIVNSQLELIDRNVLSYLHKCRFGTAERCLLTARLFGDESEVRFWTVALHYLISHKYQPLHQSFSSSSLSQNGDVFIPQKEMNDLVLVDNDESFGEKKFPPSPVFKDQPLEKCFDFLCDNQSFKKYQLDRVALHDSKRATYDHTKKCAENYIMLGQTDRAVQLLLETEPDRDAYYTDSLKACLVASVRSSGASQSTIKLVATNLIANGKLIEGVQLLCMIDKGLDACRYLQTYGSWDKAVWLAKSALEITESSEVMKKWVDHLCSTSVNQKSLAVLVMLSLGKFMKVVEMLYGMRQFTKAACLIEAGMEFDLIRKTEETGTLIEAVFLEYARFLSNLGHRKAAEYYCKQAGEKGQQLLKEVEILFS